MVPVWAVSFVDDPLYTYVHILFLSSITQSSAFIRSLLFFVYANVGSWAGDVNDCWEYCYGKQQYVIDQLDDIVRAQNFDGVDIDYEYHYDSQDAQDFLNDITVGLKTTLPAGQNIITHAPMEPDAEQGTAYYNILKSNAAYLDFLLPQYYNGYTRPAIDGLSDSSTGSRPNALPHYNTLVNDMFGGDATKVVFGFCVSLCMRS